MRHAKRSCKLNRTTSHRRALWANMLKSLIMNESITTTIPKAKELRRFADQMITLAKKNDLASKRQAVAELMISFNTLSPKEKREVKEGNTSSYNPERQVINKLFHVLGPRFSERKGGYTRITRTPLTRKGDNTELCEIQYLAQ